MRPGTLSRALNAIMDTSLSLSDRLPIDPKPLNTLPSSRTRPRIPPVVLPQTGRPRNSEHIVFAGSKCRNNQPNTELRTMDEPFFRKHRSEFEIRVPRDERTGFPGEQVERERAACLAPWKRITRGMNRPCSPGKINVLRVIRSPGGDIRGPFVMSHANGRGDSGHVPLLTVNKSLKDIIVSIRRDIKKRTCP